MNAFTSVTNNADARAAERHRDAGERCSARRHPAAAVEIDAEEDRLGEEREALERERQPDDPPKRAHEARARAGPSSNDSTVPDTAPTANRMLVPLASRLRQLQVARDRACAGSSTRRSPSAAAAPCPTAANTMWNASEIPICDRAYARPFQSIGTTGFCVEPGRHSRSASRSRALEPLTVKVLTCHVSVRADTRSRRLSPLVCAPVGWHSHFPQAPDTNWKGRN